MRSPSPTYYAPHGYTPGAQAGSAPQPYQMMPPNPEAMLLQQRRSRWLAISPLMLLLLAGLACEVAAPEAMKPSKIVGKAAANFYEEIMRADNDKGLEFIGLEEPTRVRAHREMEHVAWKGRCNALGIFDQKAGLYCLAATQAFYNQALPPARSYRQRYYRNGW